MPAKSETSPLKVGVIQSLTGIAAEDGKTVMQALELAKEDLLKKGIAVDLAVEDDETNPQKTVAAFKKLSLEHPDVIFGSTWDFTTNTLMPLATEQKVVVFNSAALLESVNLDKSDGYGFVNSISVAAEAEPFRRYLEKQKPKSLFIVYANNSWGETQRNAYAAIAERAKVNIVESFKPTSFDDNEWRQIMPRVKAKNPDLVLLLVNRSDISVFLRRAAELKISSGFFTSKNMFDAFQMDNKNRLYEGVCFTYPLEQVQSEHEFSERYWHKFGSQPRSYADSTYDALFILSAAKTIALQKKIEFKDALKQVKYEGLLGSYSYNPESTFSLGNSSLVCVRDMKFTILRNT